MRPHSAETPVLPLHVRQTALRFISHIAQLVGPPSISISRQKLDLEDQVCGISLGGCDRGILKGTRAN